MIKGMYRAKRLDNGEWVYGGLVAHNEQEYSIIPVQDFRFSKAINAQRNIEYYPVDSKTICKSTNKKDIRGKYVFENDVLLFDGTYDKEYCVGLVEYVEQEYALEVYDMIWKCFEDLRAFNMQEVLIIGNVYDDEEYIDKLVKAPPRKKKGDKLLKE